MSGDRDPSLRLHGDEGRVDVIGCEGEIVSVKPVRLGLIGCGAHAYRNVLPPLRHIPAARLTSFCDRNTAKARLYAETFGQSAHWYGHADEMLAQEELDAVLVVVGFDDESGEPLYPEVVDPVLRRGIPVWMEKPPAADRHGVARMIEAAAAGGIFAQVGFKKVFSPAVERLKQIVALPEFGPVSQYTYRYDVDLPATVGDLRSPAGRRFLDDFVHVAAVLDDLVGVPSLVQVVRGPAGAGFVVNQHSDGVIGTVVLSNAASGLSPIERLEIAGRGANAVLENGVSLQFYPPGSRGPYGTSTSYLPALSASTPAHFGPSFWDPEFSLGNLHGGSHFLQGYYHQMLHFMETVEGRRTPGRNGLEAAARIMSYLDAIQGEFGVWREVPGQRHVEYAHVTDTIQDFACPRTGRSLVLKDGWNYVCRECGKTKSGSETTEFTCNKASAL